MSQVKMVEAECSYCRVSFEKPQKEFNRSEKLGRRHFCSRSCSGKMKNLEYPIFPAQRGNGVPANRRDEFTPFRWFMLRVRQRRGKKGSTNLTLEGLKVLWNRQDGLCPFTGWKMSLPTSTMGEWPDGLKMKRASLDRIDCSKGYVVGNVRFVCCMANMARNNNSDAELMEFCKAVSAYNKL